MEKPKTGTVVEEGGKRWYVHWVQDWEAVVGEKVIRNIEASLQDLSTGRLSTVTILTETWEAEPIKREESDGRAAIDGVIGGTERVA